MTAFDRQMHLRALVESLLLPVVCVASALCVRTASASPLVSPNCAYPWTAAGDGCLAAPKNGVFQHPDFFACSIVRLGCARQSGQTPYVRLPAQNVAGVNYPVGYDRTLALKDPASDPPRGCSWSIDNHQLTCSGPNPDIENYDFGNSRWGGQTNGDGCVTLVFAGASGTITIRNNRFFNGQSVGGAQNGVWACNVYGNGIVNLQSGATNAEVASVVFTSNLCDENAQNAPLLNGSHSIAACVQGQLSKMGAGIDIEYNAFINNGFQSVHVGVQSGHVINEHNYAEGFGVAPGVTDHGEYNAGGSDQTGTAIYDIGYNTLVQAYLPRAAPVTSLIYASAGNIAPYSVWGEYNIFNNVLIANGAGQRNGVNATVSAMIEASYDRYNSIRATNNYMDPTASLGGRYMAWAPYRSTPSCAARMHVSGNIDMRSGATIDGLAQWRHARGNC